MDLRQLDPAIGRWTVMDPVTHHEYSPYSAFDNNPVYWSDPSGADSDRKFVRMFDAQGDQAVKYLFDLIVLAGEIKDSQDQIAQIQGHDSFEDYVNTVGRTDINPADENGDGSKQDGNGGPGKGKEKSASEKKVKNVNEVSSYRGIAFIGPYEYFENLSSYDYYIKPGDTNEAVLVKPGQIYVGSIDGFASKELGIIVKVSNLMSPVATDNGVSYRKSVMQDLIYKIWNKPDYQQINHVFLKNLHKSGDYGWDNLFNTLIN